MIQILLVSLLACAILRPSDSNTLDAQVHWQSLIDNKETIDTRKLLFDRTFFSKPYLFHQYRSLFQRTIRRKEQMDHRVRKLGRTLGGSAFKL